MLAAVNYIYIWLPFSPLFVVMLSFLGIWILIRLAVRVIEALPG